MRPALIFHGYCFTLEDGGLYQYDLGGTDAPIVHKRTARSGWLPFTLDGRLLERGQSEEDIERIYVKLADMNFEQDFLNVLLKVEE